MALKFWLTESGLWPIEVASYPKVILSFTSFLSGRGVGRGRGLGAGGGWGLGPKNVEKPLVFQCFW